MVAGFNSSTQILTIYNVSGTFAANINIIGTAERDAQIERNVQTVNEQASDNTTYSDNDAYEVEGDNILDFSEIDPWSEGDL